MAVFCRRSVGRVINFSAVRSIGFGALLTVICGCQMAPKRYSEVEQGSWEAKVLVQDKKKGRSHIVHLDVSAEKNKKLRLDVTNPGGYHIASLVAIDGAVEYVLASQKAIYTGRDSDRALSPIISVPLASHVFHSILFDLPIVEKSWTCTNDKKGYIQECRQQRNDIVIFWSDRKEITKLVKVQHPQAEIQMKFTSFTPNLPKKDNLFQLKKPKGFKHYRLK